MNKDIKQIKPMVCPACGKFFFSELTQEDIEDGELPNDVQCSECGWFYDLEQTNDPDLKNQSNKLSLNQYKIDYSKLKKQNPKYNYLEAHCPPAEPHKCPVCGEYTFKDKHCFDICPICGWQDDDWYEGGGANEMSLEEAIQDFQKKRNQDPSYKWFKK